MMRTHTCGELRKKDVGKKVVLCGWVRKIRDLGKLIFLDLRDRYGLIQVVFESGSSSFKLAKSIGSEYVIRVEGVVRERPEEEVNPELETGEIEVVGQELEILNRSKPPPFRIEDDEKVFEETRLRYRFLDLRRPFMQKSLEIRHKVSLVIRNFLHEKGFLEIETPYLTKSTPEGARDFIVPSRIYPGKFYALPQSPQLYKQILMVSGFDRYFQLSRCFRDEDLRADRQPEFTQIDIEMSFCEEEDIFQITENLLKSIFRIEGIEIETPFVRISYQESIEKYGTDKPDLRYELEIVDISKLWVESEFNIFREIVEGGGRIVCIPVRRDLKRREIDRYEEFIKREGGRGLLYLKIKDGTLSGPLAKYLSPSQLEQLDLGKSLTLLALGGKERIFELAGKLREKVAQDLGLINKSKYKFVWIYPFPLFVWNQEEGRLDPAHHMFTMPFDEDIEFLEKEPLKVRAKQYDLVLNGEEIGGGSIRIHERSLQEKIMEMIGLGKKEREEKFGFLLESLEYGAPPHGGIALGLDRICAIIAGRETIRDVIAFPKTTKAQSLFEGAPTEVTEEQLKELHLRVSKKKEN